MTETNQNSVTFFSKNLIKCPLCGTQFQREELQTGRGRINAGDLTKELRRLYIPTQKYGTVNPLLYPLAVCTNCYFAGMPGDFQKVQQNADSPIEKSNRELAVKKIFGKSIDFSVQRDILSGLASYILGFMSTTYFPKEMSPTMRRGLYALRAAWLAGDLAQKTKLKHFSDLQKELYKQALYNYETGMEKQLRNIEPFDGFVWMGPDVDANFGYDGVIYITAKLHFDQLEFLGNSERLKKIELIKRNLSRLFGAGKITRDKPAVLVSYTRDLYASANEELKSLEKKGLDISSAINIEGLDDVQI